MSTAGGPAGQLRTGRHRRRRTRLAAVTVAVVAAVAGCASSASRTSSPTTPSPTAPGQAGIDGTDSSELPTLPGAAGAPALPDPTTKSTQLQYVTAVFDDMQNVWSAAFRQAGLPYTPATLRTFSAAVGTSCGVQTSDVGPFYCPADVTVNLDLQFFAMMWQQTGAGGDFAEAYVVAHEMGHHVQNLLGISGRVAAAEAQDPAAANSLSVRVELQADCLAGVWAHTTYTRHLLQPGDLDRAVNAAVVVGDDYVQQMAGGRIDPDSWTHGSSAQRAHWLTVGFDTGTVGSCNSFTGPV